MDDALHYVVDDKTGTTCTDGRDYGCYHDINVHLSDLAAVNGWGFYTYFVPFDSMCPSGS